MLTGLAAVPEKTSKWAPSRSGLVGQSVATATEAMVCRLPRQLRRILRLPGYRIGSGETRQRLDEIGSELMAILVTHGVPSVICRRR